MTEDQYNKSEYSYYQSYDNVRVKMCKDKVPVPYSWLFGADSTRGRPYLDYECVESIAAALYPNIAEAGANAIRLFVPSLKMEITEAKLDSGGIVRGKVSYTIPSFDDEYSGLFDLDNVYNGPVSLFINNTDTKIKVNAKKNYFEFRLDGKIQNLKKEDVAVAKLDLGGIVLKSDEKMFATSDILKFIQLKKYFSIQFDIIATFSDGTTTCIFEGDGCQGFRSNNFDYFGNQYLPIYWNGGEFSISRNYSNPPEYGAFSYNYTITGTFQDDGTIVNLAYDYKDTSGWEYSFKVEGVKVTSIFRDENNPDLGNVTLYMNQYNPSANGVLKEIKAKEPVYGTAISFKENSFEMTLYFADEE
ncbi:MAG: hypothetical protein NTV01_07405 [Bacteroidia bacterium]|nr:hypothetical protein [Bacteroidia bacterium]